MSNGETSIERMLHRIEGRIVDWRRDMGSREADLQTHREMLFAEAAEREKLLRRATSEERDREPSFEEAAMEHRVVFVVHSKEAGRALEEFASGNARLVSVVHGSGSEREGEDIKGSWLVFEREEESS